MARIKEKVGLVMIRGRGVETKIHITEPEVDAKLFGEPVSIKTITGKSFGGVKLMRTC